MARIPISESYWKQTVGNYLATWVGQPVEEIHKSEEAYETIREFACNVLIHLAASNGIKNLPPQGIMGHPMSPGISVHVDDGEVLRHIRFGVYMDQWFVESYLPCAESLPHMDDRFWHDILEISAIGKTEIHETCPIGTPSGTPKRFMDTKKSVTFRLIRNLIFRTLADPQGGADVGILTTQLSVETPYLELMNSLRHAYGLYYRCVGRLVRHTSAKRKK